MLKFIQINLHKSQQATVLLGQDMEGQSQIISFVTEPHTIHNKITGMPKGTITIAHTTNNQNNNGPRAGIVADRGLWINGLDKWCNRDCAVAMAHLHGRQVILASIYLDINEPVNPPWLEAIMAMADSKGLPVMLAVDSNAHSSLYGPDNNARGDTFEDFILEHGLEVLNTGNTPTFETRRGNGMAQTHIDVTLSRGMHFPISNWRVDRSYNGSDHNTIRFEAAATPQDAIKTRPWSKADWQVFDDTLRHADYRIPVGMSMKKLDKLTKRMYDLLQEALDRACPEVTTKPIIKRGFWATDSHDKDKTKVSNLYKRAKTSGSVEDWQAYKQADKAFKHRCKRDKNKAWRLYKESLQSHKDMANLVKIAQRQERKDVNVLSREDGTTTNPGKETIELLTETHFPAATNRLRVSYNNRKNCLTSSLEDKYKEWINPRKINQALAGFEKKKSPGPDGIKPLIFEHLPPQFIETLNIIYRACIHLGYTPKEWKRTRVIFISKPGKDEYDAPKSFRPISLSNYFLKGLERLVGWKMDQALVHFPIHHKQHGFQNGKSTESAISNTTDYIEKFIMNKQHCVGVFLDISSAFDSIKASHVRRALLDHGGDPDLVQWYYNYISHRDIEISLHGTEAAFSTGVGFPQGGVCSAKFWLIAFDFAIKIINTYNIEGNGFADDCSALYGGACLDTAIRKLQKMLDSLTKWGRKCGLKFNPEKSVAVLFTRSRKTPTTALRIDGQEIPYRKEVKYLGITLDSKLHWKPHIDDKIRKTKRFLGHVANITRNNWGPKPALMRWAYLSVVRPMLCYGSMIWGHRAKHHATRLRRINRMAFNTFASFPKSTPTTALEVMLDVMPLHIFCQQEGTAARCRLNRDKDLGWTGTGHTKTHRISHLKHWQTELRTARIDLENTDRCSMIKWGSYSINRESFTGEAKHRTLSQYNVFTDGSRIDNQTGAGFAIYQKRNELFSDSRRLPDHCTVFQAEITAIEQAAKLLSNSTYAPKFVKFFVDSQAAILALANPRVKSKTVASAIDALNTLTEQTTAVQICWIPAHRGHFGNEKADSLAKTGAKHTHPRLRLRIPKPEAAIKNDLHEHIYRQWTKEWQDSSEAQHTKHFFLGPMPSKSKYIYKLARLELGRFIRLITGHNNLNQFQTRIGLWHSASCRLCEDSDETFIHLITECPRLWHTQRDAFQGNPPCADMQWSVRTLLEFSYIPTINEAFEGTQVHHDPPNRDDLQSTIGSE